MLVLFLAPNTQMALKTAPEYLLELHMVELPEDLVSSWQMLILG